jgi:hypothetical protein
MISSAADLEKLQHNCGGTGMLTSQAGWLKRQVLRELADNQSLRLASGGPF